MSAAMQASPVRADARRNIEAILAAAETCLAQDPDASMGDIAAAAGLGRVTVYGHFKSRGALVEAVITRVLGEVNSALEALDLSGDPKDALARLIDATWQLTLRSGALIIAAERALPSSTVQAAHAGPMQDRVHDLLASAQASGDFRSDLPTSWLVATVHAVVHAAANEIEAGRLDPEQAAGTITKTLLGAFAAGGPSAP